MNEPRWIGREECLVIHEMMVARHGGVPGVRDEALLQSALARPRERFASCWASDTPAPPRQGKGNGSGGLAELAACYASAVVLTRPFLSGNLCTGFLLAVTFLRANGFLYTGREMPVVEQTSNLATGEASEALYAMFLNVNSRLP